VAMSAKIPLDALDISIPPVPAGRPSAASRRFPPPVIACYRPPLRLPPRRCVIRNLASNDREDSSEMAQAGARGATRHPGLEPRA
jgi:hypothetical protein